MRLIFPTTAIVLALTSALAGAAMAQSADPRDPYRAGSGGAARDGCVNIPMVPHNSADCSRIPLGDLNSIVNADGTDLDGRVTGATENAQRNRRILDEMRRSGSVR
jgi:hypothetical protein